MATQSRYDLTALIASDIGLPLVSYSKKIGIRRVELVQGLDKFGKSFYFRINNVDVFAGGSCWIPADSFLPAIGAERYKKWLELMFEGNQIMTR